MRSSEEALDPTGIVEGHSPGDTAPYTPSQHDEHLAGEIHARLEECREYRQTYERSWDIFRRYLKGERITMHRGELVRLVPEDAKRLYSKNNTLRPIARSFVAKLHRAMPYFRVKPRTLDFEDIHAAHAADSLLTYFQAMLKMKLKVLEALESVPWGGNGFLQLLWNRDGGDRIAWCDICGYKGKQDEIGEVCPVCTMQREQELQLQAQEQAVTNVEFLGAVGDMVQAPVSEEELQIPQVPQQQLGALEPDAKPAPLVEAFSGEIELRNLDLRDVFVPPGYSNVDELPYVAIRHILDTSAARSMFPSMMHLIEDNSLEDADRVADRIGAMSDDGWSSADVKGKGCLWEILENPTELYPKGRQIFMWGKVILEERDNPYYCLGRFPLYRLGGDRNVGEFYLEGWLAQAWHRQRELDNNETATREAIELLLKPKWLLPMGGRVTVDEFTATSAQAILYNRAAGPIEQLNPPPVPADVWNRGAQLVTDIQAQAAVTDSDRGVGQTDPNGRALAIISAEANQQLAGIILRNNEELRELCRGILLLCLENYDEDRTAVVAGPDGLEVLHWKKVKRGLANGFDVEIEEHDGLSTNPAVRLQSVMELAGLGAFVDPMTGRLDKRKFARAAKIDLVESGYEAEATERANAAALPERLKRGEPFAPQMFDDPIIHAEVLLGWLRGPGRQAENQQVLPMVMSAWMYYEEWKATAVMPMTPQLGGPSQPGGLTTAPGGTPSNTGGIGTGIGPIQAESSAATSAADSQAEGAARTTQKHE